MKILAVGMSGYVRLQSSCIVCGFEVGVKSGPVAGCRRAVIDEKSKEDRMSGTGMAA